MKSGLVDEGDGKGVDLWETGHTKSAKKIYKEVIGEFPEFIDAYHHLGMLYEEEGKDQLAFENWLKGYRKGIRMLLVEGYLRHRKV